MPVNLVGEPMPEEHLVDAVNFILSLQVYFLHFRIYFLTYIFYKLTSSRTRMGDLRHMS